MRKQTPDFDSIFRKRLGDLLEGEYVGKKTPQQDLANKIGTTRQTVSEYKNGTSIPNADKLRGIAEFYDVSADFLLGLSDDPTNNGDLKTIYEKIGLSSKAMNDLQQYDATELLIFNLMLEKRFMYNLVSQLKESFIATVKFAQQEPDFLRTLTAKYKNEVYMSVKKWELHQSITKIIEDIYSDFLADHWDNIETHIKEQAEKESKIQYDEMGFPIEDAHETEEVNEEAK